MFNRFFSAPGALIGFGLHMVDLVVGGFGRIWAGFGGHGLARLYSGLRELFDDNMWVGKLYLDLP